MTVACQIPGPVAADYSAIKVRQQAMWAAGDYATIECKHLIASERLCEAMDLFSKSS